MVDVVKIGTNVNDGTGDDLRTAFQKVNAKFTELDAKGGETNTASNLGTAVAGEGVFASKNAFDLQFKRIKSADQNKLSITSDGTSIILDNTAVDNPAIRTVQFSNDPNNVNNSITTSVGNESVGLVGGSNISLTASGTRNILITGSFTLDQDSTPELGGNLALQGNNIIGPGDITSITNVNSTNGNITDLTVTGRTENITRMLDSWSFLENKNNKVILNKAYIEELEKVKKIFLEKNYNYLNIYADPSHIKDCDPFFEFLKSLAKYNKSFKNIKLDILN